MLRSSRASTRCTIPITTRWVTLPPIYTSWTTRLTPAARWANGQIDDFTLNVSAKQTAKHFFIPVNCLPGMKPVVKSGTGKTREERHDMSEDGVEWEVALRKGAIQFHAKNFRPKEELALHSGLLCGGLAATYDRSKFMGDCGWVEHDEQSLRIMRNLPTPAADTYSPTRN